MLPPLPLSATGEPRVGEKTLPVSEYAVEAAPGEAGEIRDERDVTVTAPLEKEEVVEEEEEVEEEAAEKKEEETAE